MQSGPEFWAARLGMSPDEFIELGDLASPAEAAAAILRIVDEADAPSVEELPDDAAAH